MIFTNLNELIISVDNNVFKMSYKEILQKQKVYESIYLITHIAITRDNSKLLVATQDGFLDIVDMFTFENEYRLQQDNIPITFIVSGEDGYIITASKDNNVRIWHLKTKRCVDTFKVGESEIMSFVYNAKYSTISCITQNEGLFMIKLKFVPLGNYDYDRQYVVETANVTLANKKGINCTPLSLNIKGSEMIMVGSNYGMIFMVDITDYTHYYSFQLTCDDVIQISDVSNRDLAIVCDKHNNTWILNLYNGGDFQTLSSDIYVTKVEVSDDGNYIATFGMYCGVNIYKCHK
jgi:WD40 repeat protein